MNPNIFFCRLDEKRYTSTFEKTSYTPTAKECLSPCLSVCLPARLPAFLPACLSNWVSVCLSVFVSVCLSVKHCCHILLKNWCKCRYWNNLTQPLFWHVIWCGFFLHFQYQILVKCWLCLHYVFKPGVSLVCIGFTDILFFTTKSLIDILYYLIIHKISCLEWKPVCIDWCTYFMYNLSESRLDLW